jgi:hypothetical protein
LLSCDHWFGRATIDAILIVEDWIEVGDLDRDFMSIGDLVRRVTDEAYKEALAILDNERKAAEDDDDPGPDPGAEADQPEADEAEDEGDDSDLFTAAPIRVVAKAPLRRDSTISSAVDDAPLLSVNGGALTPKFFGAMQPAGQ